MMKAIPFPTDEERLLHRNQALEDDKTHLLIEIDHLKTLLRKYAFTEHTGKNTTCNCCHWFGLYVHKPGCELAPYLTKATPVDGEVKS